MRTAEFRRDLPNELKERVVAEEHLDIGESEGELLDELEEKTRVSPLTDVLVDLAARGARLDFMLGENENTDVLRDEFGGLAGLTRF